MIKNVGLVGLGAVGILYVLQFQKALGQENVFVIADEDRIARYRRDGVVVNGKPLDALYVTGDEASPVDLLVFVTKYHGLESAAHTARQACGPETIVMSFLNGVSSEGVVEGILHPAHLLYTTVQGMDATKEENRMVFSHTGSVTFNGLDGLEIESVKAVSELFDRAGIVYTVPDDIRQQQWSKWMLNVGVNQVCAVHGVGYGGVQEGSEFRGEMIEAMREAQTLAAAEGIALDDAEMDKWLALIDELDPNGEPSMRQDTKAGRQTEVELFAGLVRKLSRKHGIPTPVNDRLFELLVR